MSVWLGSNTSGRWHYVSEFAKAQYFWRMGYKIKIGGMTYNKHDMDMSRRHIETLFHKRIYG